ncbi:hypothetical protein GQ42DRAFT_163878 [Ramicandelaber brevisporus]|nr:hypothetical protein GQ42DRAFT_163878 [Ramicandelaber brevisporus]
MNAALASATRQCNLLSASISKLESYSSSDAAFDTDCAQITNDLSVLKTALAECRRLAQQELAPARRQHGLERTSALVATSSELQARFDQTKGKIHRQRAAVEQRNELFHRPSGSAAAASAETENGGGGGGAMAIEMGDFLHRSEQAIEGFIDVSRASLGALREQRKVIRGARERMINTAETLGVSRSVIRFIDRRVTEDKWIFWVGVIIVIVFIYYAFRFFRH